MNENFKRWQEITRSSEERWVEDEITKLNGGGALYYKGGEDGSFIRISPANKLTVGTYEGAYPHIGEAIFRVEAEHQYDNQNDAFQAAWQLGGKQFLADMFSGDCTPTEISATEEPDCGGFNMKM